MFPKSQWTDWARAWGFTHRPQKGKLYRDEAVAGQRDGLLVQAQWAGENGATLVVTVRFPAGQDLERVRAMVVGDAALDALPGRGAARRNLSIEQPGKRTVHIGSGPEFLLADGVLRWTRTFAWKTPKPDEVRGWVEALTGSLQRAGLRFDGRCEQCRQREVAQYVMVNGAPVLLCTSCQQELSAQGEMAERTYAMQEANHARGILFASAGVVVGAAVWAALAIGTNRMFAVVGILTGAMVGWAYHRGAGKVDGAGRAIAVVMSVLAVALGDVAFVTWMVAKVRPDVGLDPGIGLQVTMRMLSESPGDAFFSLLCGLLGAWMAVKALQKPQLKPVIEQAGEAGRKAA